MFKRASFVLIAIFAMNSAGADNVFRIGYAQSSVGVEGTVSNSTTAVDFENAQYGGTSNKPLQTYFVQWDFLQYLGVRYQHSSASGYPVTFNPSRIAGNADMTANAFGLEARYPVRAWLDLFVRVNQSRLSVAASGTSVFHSSMTINTNQSVSDTYPSAGLRAKFTQHFGAEIAYDDYGSVLKPTLSLGLFVQF